MKEDDNLFSRVSLSHSGSLVGEKITQDGPLQRGRLRLLSMLYLRLGRLK